MFKKYFITGLLIWVPLAITVWVLGLLVATLEGFVPGFLSSQSLFGVDIPGFRFVLVITVVLLTGVFAANLLGRSLLEPLGAHPGAHSAGALDLQLGQAGQRYRAGAQWPGRFARPC
ncbi:membrane protein [Bordetella pertussis]|nr:membrane protein [Bordetella pertussis]